MADVTQLMGRKEQESKNLARDSPPLLQSPMFLLEPLTQLPGKEESCVLCPGPKITVLRTEDLNLRNNTFLTITLSFSLREHSPLPNLGLLH